MLVAESFILFILLLKILSCVNRTDTLSCSLETGQSPARVQLNMFRT